MERAKRLRRLLFAAVSVLVLIAALSTWVSTVEPREFPSKDSVVALKQLKSPLATQLDLNPAQGEDSLNLVQDLYKTKAELEDAPLGPETDEVRVGVFLLNNYDLDMTVPMASSTGKVWLRWKEPFQRKLEAAKVTAADLLIFPNQIQAWNGQTSVVGDAPTRLANGDYYQRIRFDNNFYVEHLGLEHYPFQTLHIPLMIQINNAQGDFNFRNLRLIPDRLDSGVGRFIDLNGFVMRGWNIAEFRTTFNSDFGLEKDPTSKQRLSLSEVIFDVIYSRSVRSSIWTLFQPLAIVMATVILSPSLSSRFWDIRIAIPATAILTMVFLQQSYRADLPQLPFLTFIDRIYAICYVLCLACFALYVWAANRLHNTDSEREAVVARQIDQVDWQFQCFCVISLIIGGLLSWYVVPTT